MAQKFDFEITNDVQLNQDGLAVLEIKNDDANTYDYYVYHPGYALEHVFGILQTEERFDSRAILDLHENGYFDGIIADFQ